MKTKTLSVLIMLALVMAIPTTMAKREGTWIQDGTLTYSAGHYLEGTPLVVSYDDFGYNYQAHMFDGYYCNAYLGRDGFPPYEGDDEAYLAENPEAESHWTWPWRDTIVMMQWNDAWLSNKDMDEDGSLDRYYGYPSYDGSGAWLTNHMYGTNEDGTKWTSFIKIITPSTAAGDYKFEEMWYHADGSEIGPVIWGAFAIIQDFETNAAGFVWYYKSTSPVGFGAYPGDILP